MPLILAHDLGATGNKASLFDDQGRLVASHTEHYPVNYAQHVTIPLPLLLEMGNHPLSDQAIAEFNRAARAA
jgi:glycerol kinase